MISDQWAVVRVPFPFADRTWARKRPALVLTTRRFNMAAGHTVMAMITRRERTEWPQDYDVREWVEAGLKLPSWIRLKLFTIENSLIIDALGMLRPIDVAGFQETARIALR